MVGPSISSHLLLFSRQNSLGAEVRGGVRQLRMTINRKRQAGGNRDGRCEFSQVSAEKVEPLFQAPMNWKVSVCQKNP